LFKTRNFWFLGSEDFHNADCCGCCCDFEGVILLGGGSSSSAQLMLVCCGGAGRLLGKAAVERREAVERGKTQEGLENVGDSSSGVE
jgi:hypothetical protein